jgi:hypothetical protein
VHRIREVDAKGAAVQAARALGISFGDCVRDENPFLIEPVEIATSADVELDAEFTLDVAESAAEEALAE